MFSVEITLLLLLLLPWSSQLPVSRVLGWRMRGDLVIMIIIIIIIMMMTAHLSTRPRPLLRLSPGGRGSSWGARGVVTGLLLWEAGELRLPRPGPQNMSTLELITNIYRNG